MQNNKEHFLLKSILLRMSGPYLAKTCFGTNELQKRAGFFPVGWRFQGHFNKERRNATHFVRRVHISRICQYL